MNFDNYQIILSYSINVDIWRDWINMIFDLNLNESWLKILWLGRENISSSIDALVKACMSLISQKNKNFRNDIELLALH